MYSRDILLQAKGDHLGRVHSDQMVLEMIRGGGWSSRAILQPRPRVSKLGLKRLSDYYSSEIAVEAARLEASRPNKRATLTECFLKEKALDNSSKPNPTRAKGSLPEKIPLLKKSYSLYISLGNVAEGVDEVSEDDDE
jgi:hypothetical protein